MDLQLIQQKIKLEQYEISYHAEKERYEEDITLADIETAIHSGEILEDYPDDPRGSSCLMLGYSQGRAIHLVCGYTTTGWIRIITVYLPKMPKWSDDRTRNKERNL